MKIERSTRLATGRAQRETPGALALRIVAVLAFVLLGSSSAGAQGNFLSATPTPTPIPGGAAAIGETLSPEPTRGAGSPGLIQHPQSIEFSVGSISVFPPDNDCAHLILQALQKHAPVTVPVSDRRERDARCAEQMNRALDLERTRPECAEGPCW